MLGIYIHVPFCSTKCGYCDFYSIIRLTNKDDYINALVKEITLRKDEISDKVNTVYFGGGTPSMLSRKDFAKIFAALHNYFDMSSVSEVTVEVNPDDVTQLYIEELKALGVNRVSMGIQSFNNRILKFMNRRHNAKQAIDAVNNIKKAGIHNISIDLIYGIPGMSNKEWLSSIQKAIDLKVQHISAYHLTFEPDTPFYKRLQNNEIKEINDEISITQYNTLVSELNKNGFEDYEISNFSLPGLPSQHNSNYWNGNAYIGLGPSAHSFNGKNRRWNKSQLSDYIDLLNNASDYFETELLSESEIYNEAIMLSLRTKKGLFIDNLLSRFSNIIKNHFNLNLDQNINENNVVIENGFLKVASNKKFLTDKIISDFFIV